MPVTKLENAMELCKMEGKEGLVFQGCGGDLQEWVDGVNALLSDAEILRNGTKFEHVKVFEMPNCTCLLFPFEDPGENLNVEKLAMWRLRTYETFGAMWLSDFVENKLGGFVPQKQQKPMSPIIGADGNIFSIIGIASQSLKNCGMREEAKEMRKRVTAAGSYSEALAIITEYVEPVDVSEWEPSEEPEMEGF